MNTLHITKDNQVVTMDIEEIFDTKSFDTFIGVTFSITSSFINRYLSHFKK